MINSNTSNITLENNVSVGFDKLAESVRPWTPARTAEVTGIDWGGEVALQAHTGKRISTADFRGKIVVLFFGYSHCPDICGPTLASRLLGPPASPRKISDEDSSGMRSRVNRNSATTVRNNTATPCASSDTGFKEAPFLLAAVDRSPARHCRQAGAPRRSDPLRGLGLDAHGGMGREQRHADLRTPRLHQPASV